VESLGWCKFLILLAHLLPNFPDRVTSKHFLRSSDSRWEQPSSMAYKPSFVSWFPIRWRWCNSGTFFAIAIASSSHSIWQSPSVANHCWFHLNDFKREQQCPTASRDSFDNEQSVMVNTSNNGSFVASHNLWSTGVFLDSGAGASASAGLDNFWKSRVWMPQGMAIKKLLKIFLFLFSIYC